MICEKCGEPIAQDALYCENCGARAALQADAAQSAEQAHSAAARENMPLDGATISHHLSVLKDAGLVSDEKRGKYIFYELDTSVLQDMLAWVAGFAKGDGDETKQ